MRIYELLKRANATAPERAITDRVIASRVHCPVRNVVDHSLDLLNAGIPVVASCGKRNAGTRGKGRYIENDEGRVREYAKALQKRGVKVILRCRAARRCSQLMAEKNAIDSRGQRRLFA